MMSRFAVGLRCGRIAHKVLTRNIGVSSVCYQKAQASSDPIQKLFIDKIHEYAQKSKVAGGKFVDASPETEKQLQDELEKLARQYGAKGADFTKFPTFGFADPDLEPVGVQVEIKPAALVVAEEEAAKEEDLDKPYWQP
jgi:F-type H+-transporting ATPase subunit 6